MDQPHRQSRLDETAASFAAPLVQRRDPWLPPVISTVNSRRALRRQSKNSSRTGSPVNSVRPAGKKRPSLQTDQRALHPSRDPAVGKARHRIRLHDDQRHTAQQRRQHRWTRHVTAHAEDRRRLPFAEPRELSHRFATNATYSRARVTSPRFLMPPTRIFSRRNPAAGTSRFSTPRSVPTNKTSCPIRPLPAPRRWPESRGHPCRHPPSRTAAFTPRAPKRSAISPATPASPAASFRRN